MKRRILFFALAVSGALCVLLGATACSRKPAVEPLRVGMELSYPPFEMADVRGNPAGVSVDLARALGVYLHRAVEIENIPFSGLIPALQSRKIDLIISSMTATPERAQAIDFSQPYLQTGLCLLLAKKTTVSGIENADEPGRVIVVKKGTTGQIYAAAHFHKAKVLAFDREAACVLEVIQGKADVFIYDQMSVFKHWQENAAATRAVLAPFQQESWAVGLRRGDVSLTANVNAFLANFRARGGFGKLGDRYLAEQKVAFRKLRIPFYF